MPISFPPFLPLMQGSQTQINRRAKFQIKNALRAAVYKKSNFCGPHSSQIMLILIKIYALASFWDVRGPHKYIWRAVCLRPLL